MRRRIRLTEGDLKRMVARSVKRILRETTHKRHLNEIFSSFEDPKVTVVNDPDSAGTDRLWNIGLWPGIGYGLGTFAAYAYNEEDALEWVVAYLDKEGNDAFFIDDWVESELENGDMTQEEIDEEAIYIDATMYDAKRPHYVYAENLTIYPDKG